MLVTSEAVHIWGQGVYGNSWYFLLNFFCEAAVAAAKSL